MRTNHFQKSKTHCPQGHPYSRKNTRIKRDGARECKTCSRVRSLAWYHRQSTEKKAQIAFNIQLWRYRLTEAEYKKMVRRFRGRCWICRQLPSGKGPYAVLHIDHDAETGEVRGLLCGNCNNGLGRFKDSPKRLRAAANYLESQWRR